MSEASLGRKAVSPAMRDLCLDNGWRWTMDLLRSHGVELVSDLPADVVARLLSD